MIDLSCSEPLVEGDEYGSIKLLGARDPENCGFGSFPDGGFVMSGVKAADSSSLPKESKSNSSNSKEPKSKGPKSSKSSKSSKPPSKSHPVAKTSPTSKSVPPGAALKVKNKAYDSSDPYACKNWSDCNQGACMEDNFVKYRKGGHLVCTAKEVTLSRIEASERMTCEEGSMVKIDALKASVHFNTGRYDVGWYIAKDGKDALNGECYIQPLLEADPNVVKTVVASPGSSEVVGEITWDADHKGKNDKCGDVHMFGGGGGCLDFVSIGQGLELPCIDKTSDGYMDFAICFSWRQPGGDDTCIPNELYPGTPSKCFCTRYNIPSITVTKANSITECK